MLQLQSRLALYTLFLVTLLSSLSGAIPTWTLPLGLGTPPPPAILLTDDISPQCEAVNNGTYLCCAGTFDGGFPLVADAAEAAGYQLPANTVNGIICKESADTCPLTSVAVCCQVIKLLPIGLWCQNM